MILVVGATGQLGTAVIRKLVAARQPVRALVRPDSSYQHLAGGPVDLAFGDLRDPASLAAACRGVSAVIATANAILPRRGDSFEATEGRGYASLIAACREQGVRQFIYIAVPVTPHDAAVKTFRYKRLNEQRLRESGLDYTLVRASLFMDEWLALIGSSVPMRGAEAHTLRRPFWFSRMFMGLVGSLVEGRGLAVIPGSGRTRHAFVALDDVAEFLVRCLADPRARSATFHLGGPEILTWDEAVQRFGQALGRRVRPLHTPAGLFRLNNALLSPLSEGAGNIMGLNWLVGTCDTAYDPAEATAILGRPLTRLDEFLRQKLALDAQPRGAALPAAGASAREA